MKIKIDENGEALWTESINLGVMGIYNEIVIDLDGCEIAGVEDDDMPEEEKLLKASKYYGDRFKKLEADVKYINEQFLMWIITHLCDIEYPFWEFGRSYEGKKKYPDYIIEEEMKKFENENGQVIHNPYSSSPVYEKLSEYNPYENKDNLTSYEIVEGYLPVLDFKKLIATIEAQSLDTFEEEIHFQLSSEVCGGMLLCATYGTIYENNKLEGTHNC